MVNGCSATSDFFGRCLSRRIWTRTVLAGIGLPEEVEESEQALPYVRRFGNRDVFAIRSPIYCAEFFDGRL